MEIKIELGDVFYNAGVVGLIKILEHAGQEVSLEDNYISFSSEILSNIPQYYFNFFIDNYKHSTSWGGITTFQIPTVDMIDEKSLEKLNKHIEFVKKALTSNSYKNTYPLIKEAPHVIEQLIPQLKQIKLKKKESIEDVKYQIQEILQILREINEYLNFPETKKYIIPRNIIYSIIQNYWGGVSFLHKKSNVKDMYEELYNYFISPIEANLEEKKDEEKYNKYKYQCFTCENKFAKLGDAFELTWINKTGVDSGRKSSHFWNHQSDSYICSICNFIYACIPAGFISLNGKGIFINENTSTKSLKNANSLILYKETGRLSIDELEEQAFGKIMETVDYTSVGDIQKEIQNIQIVKLDSENTQRPYSFNMISRERMEVVKKNKKNLSFLVGKRIKDGKEYISPYQQVIKRIYHNQNQFDFIYYLFKLVIRENLQNQYGVIKNIIIINNNQLKGGKEQVHYKQINNYQYYGKLLNDQYKGDSAGKLVGITHRLLNALKVKNSHRFMDTLINAYMYKNQKIPMDFIQALQDDSKFQTIGYAFLLGLQGGEIKNEENKGAEVENE